MLTSPEIWYYTGPSFQDVAIAALFWLACGSVAISIAFLALFLRRSWQRQGTGQVNEQAEDHHANIRAFQVIQEFQAIIFAIVMLVCSVLCVCITLLIVLQSRTRILPCFSEPPPISPEIVMGATSTSWMVLVAIAILCTGWITLTRSIRSAKCMPKMITQGNVMQNETRRRMMALIGEFPGIHFSRIKSAIGASPRTIRDQLRTLLSFGHIKAIKIDGKSAYFSSDSEIMTHDGVQPAMSVLAFLQRSKCDAVLRALASRPCCSFTDLVNLVGEPRSNVRRKISALEQRKYVEVTRNGREMVSVQLVPSIEEISRRSFVLGEK